MIAVSQAPIAALQAYKRRMGWTFTWVSSLNSDFNYDFNTSFTEEQQRSGRVDYNYRSLDITPGLEARSEGPAEFAAMTGTDVPTYTRETPGMSAFALSDGVVYHTYSAYARGLDSGAEGAQRDRTMVPSARRVHMRFSIGVGMQNQCSG